MPFTFSHPAIVFPLKRWVLKFSSLTGLVIGSITPDFEYFIRLNTGSVISHTLLGLLLFNLPVAFILAYVFHKKIKKTLIYMLPTPLNNWYCYYADDNWTLKTGRDVCIFSFSVLVGSYLHILWDSFTHISGYWVQRIPFLVSNMHVVSFELPVYKLLQYGGGIVGMVLVCIFLYSYRIEDSGFDIKITKREKMRYWGLIFVITTVITSLFIMATFNGIGIGSLVNYFVCFLSASMITLLVVSMLNWDLEAFPENNKKKDSKDNCFIGG